MRVWWWWVRPHILGEISPLPSFNCICYSILFKENHVQEYFGDVKDLMTGSGVAYSILNAHEEGWLVTWHTFSPIARLLIEPNHMFLPTARLDELNGHVQMLEWYFDTEFGICPFRTATHHQLSCCVFAQGLVRSTDTVSHLNNVNISLYIWWVSREIWYCLRVNMPIGHPQDEQFLADYTILSNQPPATCILRTALYIQSYTARWTIAFSPIPTPNPNPRITTVDQPRLRSTRWQLVL
jgi:hypothetical protein